MIRFIFLIGVLVGIVLTKTFSWGLEAYLRYRENRTIEKAGIMYEDWQLYK